MLRPPLMKLTPIFPIVVLSLAPIAPVAAQLIPDNTLGTENSHLTPVNPTTDRIDGGAARGSNLFHSFSEFNVEVGRSVHFDNPQGIENILTRVTGSNPSNILGTLGVLGEANLFLVNPNGIIFGPSASLDIRGSFFATTGDGIKLGESGVFSAANIDGSQLLNVKPEAIFSNALANQIAQLNSQAGLAVGPGSTLALHGGEVNVTGSLGAPGGIVEVLGDNVTVGSSSFIDVSAQTGNGGFVEVSGKNSLAYAGTVDTRGANGTVGTLLLDPKDIVISADGTITGQTVSENLSSTDVVLQAENDITVDDDITGTQGNSLSLEAGRSISIEAERTISLEGGNFSARINDENALLSERDEGIAQFVMRPGSQILTNGGDVTIDHGTLGDIAVGEVALRGGRINTAAGDISITGTGGNEENTNNLGVYIFDGAKLETTGTGNINVTGRGGGGQTDSFRNYGVRVANTGSLGTRISTEDGNLTITGMGGKGPGRENMGILIGSASPIISSRDGNITMVGTGGDTENSGGNRGIGINSATKMESTGNGNIILRGTAGRGINDNIGIDIGNISEIVSFNGEIDILGRGNGTGNGNNGVKMRVQSRLESRGQSNISLTGIGASGGTGVILEDSTIAHLGPDSREVKIQGAEIDLSNTSVRVNGTIEFQPESATGDLKLILADSEVISTGSPTAGVVVGSDSSGAIAIEGDILLNEAVRIAGGAIDMSSGTIVALEDVTFTLAASGKITTGNIYNPSGTVSISSTNGMVDTSGGIIIDRNNPLETSTQLIPDNSLGSESTVVVPIDALQDRIEGGATRGSTKLHSFELFIAVLILMRYNS